VYKVTTGIPPLSETTGIGVVQILNFIQENRYLLNFIHAHGDRVAMVGVALQVSAVSDVPGG
jgi:hypothetical protein